MVNNGLNVGTNEHEWKNKSNKSVQKLLTMIPEQLNLEHCST